MGELILEAEGQSDGNIRRIFTNGYERDWENALEKELLHVSPKARLIHADYGKNPRDYLASPLRIKMKFVIPDYAHAGENVIFFKPMTLHNLFNGVRSYLRINTSLPERKYGFRDACSRLVLLNETVKLPKGFKMKQTNREEQLKSDVAEFSGYLKQEENILQLQHKLILKKRIYEAGDWDSFRKAVNKHKAYGENEIVLEHH